MLLISAEPRTCCVATAQNTWLAGTPPIGKADFAWRRARCNSAHWGELNCNVDIKEPLMYY